ncbi:MAG: DUF4123 domain-containing protein [Hellea sp.]|nr:DUF4123 domain-containing protein [Hellea sp.]
MSDWFAAVDGAADARLYEVIEKTKDHSCLYTGEYDDDTKMALPYLVRMTRGEHFAKLWSASEGGRFWGILCQTSLNMQQLRRHLRKFTTARLPLGDVVLFRFWDPRVFVPFVENGTEEEIAPFFKGIDSIIVDLGKQGRKKYIWNKGLKIGNLAAG